MSSRPPPYPSGHGGGNPYYHTSGGGGAPPPAYGDAPPAYGSSGGYGAPPPRPSPHGAPPPRPAPHGAPPPRPPKSSAPPPYSSHGGYTPPPQQGYATPPPGYSEPSPEVAQLLEEKRRLEELTQNQKAQIQDLSTKVPQNPGGGQSHMVYNTEEELAQMQRDPKAREQLKVRKCANLACGRKYKEKDNHEKACRYHPDTAALKLGRVRLRGWERVVQWGRGARARDYRVGKRYGRGK